MSKAEHTFKWVRKLDVESVLPDIYDAQCLHLALIFPEDSGGNSKRLKSGAAIAHWFNDVMEIMNLQRKSYLAIPQENVLLCDSLCPVCTHIQLAIMKVISTFSHELAIFNNKRFNTYEQSYFYGLDLINLI